MSDRKSTIEQVQEFHDVFQQPCCLLPCIPDKKNSLLRLHLLQEELSELAAAMAAENKLEILDALCDLQYVLDGTWIACGMDRIKGDAMDRVHQSNMTKLGPNGYPILADNGRIIKGPNFEEPQLEDLLY